MYIGISIIITIFAIAKLNKALKAKREVLSEKLNQFKNLIILEMYQMKQHHQQKLYL